MSEIDDRRQRAREAARDAQCGCCPDDGVDEAIEVATRVKITDDIVKAAWDNGATSFRGRKKIIEAAFRAAGFEVVE